VARGVSRAGVVDPAAPSVEEIKQLGNILKVDAVITGVLREYGTVRSGNTSANVVSISLQMIETQTGVNVWSATST
ncbi:penicillin-binding protein activator LpoB, partial [Candidatus Saccharibacteria bacterium]|nr:penicillin-binding protein activator LpoB [Candidatus Saccharibacteria bacterium]